MGKVVRNLPSVCEAKLTFQRVATGGWQIEPAYRVSRNFSNLFLWLRYGHAFSIWAVTVLRLYRLAVS